MKNHWLGQWFRRAYGDNEDRKIPFVKIRMRSTNCIKIEK